MHFTTLSSHLHKEKEFLEYLNEEAKKIISSTPAGDLGIHHRGNSIYYGIRERSPDGRPIRERYLPVDSPLIPLLIQRYCALRVLKWTDRALSQISRLAKSYDPSEIQSLLRNLENTFGEQTPAAFISDKHIISFWENEPYTPNPYHPPGEVLYPTKKGECVRSKNECIAADILLGLGIPYKYEFPVLLSNGRLIYVDFKMLSPTDGREYYMEIFGMMSDSRYAEKAFQRIRDMAESDIIPGDNFIYVFESQTVPFNPDMLRKMIQHRVLHPDSSHSGN